jgi:signal transduction histidine kinase
VEIVPGQSLENGDMKPEVKLISRDKKAVAESRLLLGDNTLVIGFDARRFSKRIKLLRFEFVLFVSVLAVLGSFFSWLLYRYQAAEKKRTRNFERQLAHQKEEAALGRTTATIAHEVRNPLNAISIGLQRLQLETEDLSEEHKNLLHSMETAVQRTNTIIADLQKYSRPVEFSEQDIDITEIIKSVTTLYDRQCSDQNIQLSVNSDSAVKVRGDKELLGQVCENLVKNAVEAQKNGGFIDVKLWSEKTKVFLTIENGGLTVSPEEFSKITEPYFTTKAKGCGLGLAICKKIIESHAGHIDIKADREKNTFMVKIQLAKSAS